MGVPEVTRDNVASYLQRVRKDEVNQSDLSMRLWKYEKEIFRTAEHVGNYGKHTYLSETTRIFIEISRGCIQITCVCVNHTCLHT